MSTKYILARKTRHVAPVFGSIIITTYWWVCVRVHVQAPGIRRRGESEGLGEIGGSPIEIITLVERGERIGTAMLSIVLLHRSIPTDIVIYLFIFNFILVCFQDHSFEQRPSFVHL